MRGVRAWLGIATAAALLFVPASAQASFHEMKIREVYAGGGTPDADYVELQMYAPGQTFVGGHVLQVYDGAGTLVDPFLLPDNVSHGANQATILIGGTQTQAATGVAPDFVDPGLPIGSLSAGGAVCWPDGSPPDCAVWGTFTAPVGFPDPAAAQGTFAGGIPANMALNRRIDRGCPTLLENPADDVGPTSTDFTATAPNPRNNASPITETACSGGGGGGGSDNKPPNTKIGKIKVSGSTAKVTFSGSDDQAGKLSFKCKLDKKKFKSCKSPKKFKHLKSGRHKVQVEAIDAAGNVDPSPAKKKFTV